MFGKLLAILNTPIRIPFPSPAVKPAATVQVPPTLVIIPIDDDEPPVLSAAQAELEVAKNSLQTMKDAKAKAKAEAKVLDAVHETNQLVRQLAIEMGEQELLPRQLEERRKAAEADNQSVSDMIKDLGF